VAASAERAPEREQPSPAPQEERPEPEEELPDPELRDQPEPEPEISTRRATPEPPPQVEPARSDEKEGAESVNVELDGEIFPYPGYLENIIRQVHRYWRPPAEKRALRAELSFIIHRDGRVSDIQWIRRSGDPAFDLEARGAIEAAGRQQAFDPLPEDYPRDRLRVSFFFDPTQR
jgi:TonB family protein